MRLDTSDLAAPQRAALRSRLIRLEMQRRSARRIGFWTDAFFSSLKPITVMLGVGAALLVHGDLVVRMSLVLAGLVAAMGVDWIFDRYLARRRPEIARIDAELAAVFEELGIRRPPREAER